MQTQKQKQSAGQNSFDGLTQTQIVAYGVGHFINDLTAACWFNYLLFFLNSVVKTSASSTALLVGQVSDGIATPIVGYIVDRHQSKYGKRIPVYTIGFFIIIFSFTPIFRQFHSSQTLELLYYSLLPGIFNVGWACLQISHMSLVPVLTCSRKRRDILNNYRNTFTFFANLLVLLMGMLIFYYVDEKRTAYKIIAYAVILLGSATSIFFIYQINQKQLSRICLQKSAQLKSIMKNKMPSPETKDENNKKDEQIAETIETNRTLNKPSTQSTLNAQSILPQDIALIQQKKEDLKIVHWLKKPQFYLFAICYTCVRLKTNIFGTFLPFYLVKILDLADAQNSTEKVPLIITIVPLIIYFASSLTSTQLSKMYVKLGRAKTLILGALLQDITLVLVYLLSHQNKNCIYFLAVLIGISQSSILATGINLISDVVGSKSQSGAMVFGIYSFFDKITTGIVIYFVAQMDSFRDYKSDRNEGISAVYLSVIVIPFVCSTLSAIIVLIHKVSQYRQQKGETDSQVIRNEFVTSVVFN